MTVVLQGRNWTARMEVSRYGLRAGAGIDDTGAWSIGVGVRDPSGVATVSYTHLTLPTNREV